mgnify:CR=1 FL=1
MPLTEYERGFLEAQRIALLMFEQTKYRAHGDFAARRYRELMYKKIANMHEAAGVHAASTVSETEKDQP